MGCCKYFCYALCAFLVVFLAPLASNRPKVLALDDVKSWGLKGPHLSTLSKNMKGVYYLDGNQVPWAASGKCKPEDRSNNTICRNGWKRSQLVLVDTSYMHYDRDNGLLTQYAPALGVSEHKVHKGGMLVAWILLLFRVGYTWDKTDAEFVKRSADYFEGNMKLYLGPFTVGGLTGVDYRVTSEDNGDGSRIHRFTWIGGPWGSQTGQKYNVPAPKSEQFHDFKYTMRRVMDADGNIDRGVLADMKRVYGERVVFLGGA